MRAEAGRTALVTGAGAGIGRAIALRLADAGFSVAACDIDRDRAEETARLADGASGTVAPFQGDIRGDASVQAMLDAVTERCGAVDVLVNNAGASGPPRSLAQITPEAWTLVLELNVLGTFRMIQHLVPGMVERGYGRVINIASRSAFGGGLLRARETRVASMHYAASKGAVVSLTRALAIEVAGTGVTANCVAPIATETAQLLASQPDPAARARMGAATPVGRLATPEDTAHAVLYLATDSGFVTGTTLHVTGGDILT
jgi:NAD(P)-dependent dehydrogenase (short-subunit alcohol dehydrogenase family)